MLWIPFADPGLFSLPEARWRDAAPVASGTAETRGRHGSARSLATARAISSRRGASTGGMRAKTPGRVGDSSIIGAEPTTIMRLRSFCNRSRRSSYPLWRPPSKIAARAEPTARSPLEAAARGVIAALEALAGRVGDPVDRNGCPSVFPSARPECKRLCPGDRRLFATAIYGTEP